MQCVGYCGSTGAIEVKSVYDGLGRITDVSNPTSTGTTTYINTSTTYDALGRPLSVLHPTGGIEGWGYAGPVTTVTDAAGKSRELTMDAFGRLTRVVESKSVLNYETNYNYNALDNLTGVQHADSPLIRSAILH